MPAADWITSIQKMIASVFSVRVSDFIMDDRDPETDRRGERDQLAGIDLSRPGRQ